MDIEDLKKRINNQIDDWADGQKSGENPEAKAEERKLPEGKRVARTKTSGDRVYLLDDEKKIRHWVSNPDVLKALGFELNDVVEIDDVEMLKYQIDKAIWRVETA